MSKNNGNCAECPFKSRTVGNRGPCDAEIVIVGESPGTREVQKGIPFIGPSGQMLQLLLDRAGLNGRRILITNAFRCLPPRSKDEFGNKVKDGLVNGATKACRSDLMAAITQHPRQIILALGSAATRSLLNKWNLSITSARGQIVASDMAAHGIMPTFHPAHVLRNPGLLPQVQSDFNRVRELLDGATPDEPSVSYKVITSTAQIDNDIQQFFKQSNPIIVCDIEGTGLNRFKDKIRILGYIPDYAVSSHAHNTVRIIPGINNGALIKHFFNVLPASTELCWHNGKFDTSMLRAKGIPRAKCKVDHDTMLLSYLLDEVSGRHGLDACTVDHLRLPAYKDESKQWMKDNKGTWETIPSEVLYLRNAKDVVYTALIRRKLHAQVAKDKGLLQVYNHLMIPGSNTLATIELNGIPLDQEVITRNEVLMTIDREKALANIRSIVGDGDFNPASFPQVLTYVRNVLKLRVKSTDEESLKHYKHIPFIKALFDFRSVTKTLSTYVKPYKAYGARVHTTYKLTGTVTGRLSSTAPNVQNTIKDQLVRAQYATVRNPDPDMPRRKLMEIDYSQAELRSLAVLSGDPILLQIFRDGEDLHTSQAAYVYGEKFTSLPKKLPDGTSNPERDKIRRRSKTVNFGIVYGVTAPTLAEREQISISEAQNLINMWAKRFVKAWEFIEYCRQAPANNITLKTVFGRKRRYRIVTPQNRHGIENEASNFPHQSMCSDFTLRAAIIVDKSTVHHPLPGHAKQINIIHDANLFEVDDDVDAMHTLYQRVKRVMEEVPLHYGVTEIPFTVDAKVGYSWDAMSEWEE